MRRISAGIVGLALLAGCGQQDTSPNVQAAANFRNCSNFHNNPRELTDSLTLAGGIRSFPNPNPTSIVVQPDDKILVAGSIYPDQFAVFRYQADGAFDDSFGSFGYVGHALNPAQAMALQGDGKIVLSFLGENNLGPASELGLARLNPDGTLDADFGTQGLVKDARQIFRGANHLAIQADGKIVIASHTQREITQNYLLRLQVPC